VSAESSREIVDRSIERLNAEPTLERYRLGLATMTGGSGAAAVATSSLLGIRNGLYGMEMARLLRPRGLTRVLAAHLTIDESTAVGVGQDDPTDGRRGFWLTGAAVFVLWNLATLIGAYVGNALGDPKRYGLDAVAAAAFCALLWPRLHSRTAVATSALAAALALLVAPHAPAGVPVLVAALAAVIVGFVTGAGPSGHAGATEAAAEGGDGS